MSDTSGGDDAGGQLSADLKRNNDFLIVGLGGSAGAISAFKDFFRHVPPASGMAYVVILHLSPEYESHLAEVLQQATEMPVQQVTEALSVEPEHVYVIPPNKSLSMRDGMLVLSDVTSYEERRAPVDIFFRTLAESHDSRAISIIVSGTGADGSMGMKRVKELGGLVLAQEPAEAEFDEMPRNSIGTGLVDQVLPVAEMPARIKAYWDQLRSIQLPAEGEEQAQVDERALVEIFTTLRARTGHDFSDYKRGTVMRRIARRMGVRELSGLPSYALYLREHTEEPLALLKDLLISVTNFFRDSEAFQSLEQQVIPRLFQGKGPEDQVRVWVAGCATGEEAYSVAMLLSEHAASLTAPPAIQVFATDLDKTVVAQARSGYYTLNDVADVSPERLREFFVRRGEGYRVRQELREIVLFAHHNLIKDPPFSRIDLITCRNLLIYFNRAAQGRAMRVLHFALKHGGYLFLGTSETLEGMSEGFSALDRKYRIYQSRSVAARAQIPLEISPSVRIDRDATTQPPAPQPPAPREQPLKSLPSLELHRWLLELYGPPSLVVNEEYNIIHLSERAGRYLQFSAGEGTLNLLKVVRPELIPDLRAALLQAARNRASVEASGLVVETDGQRETVNVVVRPALGEDDPARGLFLVLFEQGSTAGGEWVKPPAEMVSLAEPAARRLEEENARLRAQMRATVEQYETQTEELRAANEELQSVNEELRSTSEELKTSQEELQSVNEELYTVNQELKNKIEELSHANNDMRNLISSTQIGTVFLDRSLRVKLFTPRARDIFNLIPADVDRPLRDITNRLVGDASALDDAEAVIERPHTIEREVETRDGRYYLMQLSPYRTSEDRIEGVVMTFVDITERKQAEELLRASEERLRLVIESVEDYAIFTTDTGGRIQTWNAGARRVFGYTEDEAVGQLTEIIFTPEDRAQGAPEAEMRAAREIGRAADERWHLNKQGVCFYVSGVLVPLRGSDGELTGYAKIARDLTEGKELEDALRRAHDEMEERVGTRTGELQELTGRLLDEVKERATAEQQARELLRRLVTIQENERRRIARELHDQLGQQMTALRLKLESINVLGERNSQLLEHVKQAQALAAGIDSNVDFLAWEMRPASLDELGVEAALQNFVREWAKQFGVESAFHSSGFDGERLDLEVETNLYRILQEALQNVHKHAGADRVDVVLERRGTAAVLIVEDNGKGYDAEQEVAQDSNKGMGVINMRERATLVGGSLEIESTPGGGTTIFVRVPFRAELPAPRDNKEPRP